MAINFDKLPTENPYALPPIGIYKAKVTKAEMKTGPKGPYLNLTLALSDGKGRRYGNLFDMVSESGHQVVQYKLGRLVSALKLNLHGMCELRDLAKIIVGREMCVDVTHQPDNRDETQMQAKVRVFATEIYWPIEQYEELAVMNEDNGEAADAVQDAVAENDATPFQFNAADGVPTDTQPDNNTQAQAQPTNNAGEDDY